MADWFLPPDIHLAHLSLVLFSEAPESVRAASAPADPDDPVVVTGFRATRARKLTTSEKEANRALAAAPAPVEHGFAHLKNFTRFRTDPARATGLLRALFVLRTSKEPADR